MKYLLPLLLLSVFCRGQKLPDDVMVTAYTLYNEVNDGPCLISDCLKNRSTYIAYATAESSDKTFIDNLLKLKKKAYKKASLNYYCDDEMIGGMPINNMFVISGTNIADTVFTDYTNQKIFFPDKQKAYVDKDKQLINSFPENIREFYDFDFKSHVRAMVTGKFDSIPANLIKHQSLPLSDFIKNFKINPKSFKLISTDTLYSEVERIYTSATDTITINKEFTIQINDQKSEWDIGGLHLGDNEQILKKKFPLSTQLYNITEVRFEDLKRRYSYAIRIEDNSGFVEFNIIHAKIAAITIYYDK